MEIHCIDVNVRGYELLNKYPSAGQGITSYEYFAAKGHRGSQNNITNYFLLGFEVYSTGTTSCLVL